MGFDVDGYWLVRIHLRINLPLFSTVVPAIIFVFLAIIFVFLAIIFVFLAIIFVFLSCRPFVVITTLSTGLVGVEVTSVSWLGQLTGQKHTYIRWDDGGK